MAGLRQKTRALVLQALYEADLSHHSAPASLDRLLEEHTLSSPAQEYARDLVFAVVEHQSQIDALIQEAAPQWPVTQIATVDRTLLRVAIAELLGFVTSHGRLSAPPKATINEAVELAKRFGSEGSSGFVNGVLGNVATKLLGLASARTH